MDRRRRAPFRYTKIAALLAFASSATRDVANRRRRANISRSNRRQLCTTATAKKAFCSRPQRALRHVAPAALIGTAIAISIAMRGASLRESPNESVDSLKRAIDLIWHRE